MPHDFHMQLVDGGGLSLMQPAQRVLDRFGREVVDPQPSFHRSAGVRFVDTLLFSGCVGTVDRYTHS
jgi:hypothetical protein